MLKFSTLIGWKLYKQIQVLEIISMHLLCEHHMRVYFPQQVMSDYLETYV